MASIARSLVFGLALGELTACSLITEGPDLSSNESSGTSSGGSFCSSLSPQPMFCDDFDSEQDLQPHWGAVDSAPLDAGLGPDLGVSLDSSVAHSQPTSL